ncbi:putative 7-deoxyloganetin glucosyltransferase [Helianthus annuus]|uniref:7-deoxyloganetin glucosyltransferase n=1 Tax=Helianthus annuus TaxID=4232 RepID=A0A251UV84_HELAN|nr:UDP-glycosyltransferase 87A1 [Helianthus annuus]KAF5808271.1 putative 7-deoxyloganetin glucosyltransferase [Helianthus annuus]KAJ0595441.1 putative 7-deoxyloganetin glucosyltransferase [Helianthus annuus]KAJ0925042.1 putative 7-deoxyloganetin glucosyltransferase [Helianthus annuus]
MNQVLVIPYPGRGHINPILNLCHLLSSRLNRHSRTTIFTVVVTEEWLGFLNPDPEQDNIRFVTIPNVIPSELNRGSNMVAFVTAVQTKMEGPVVEVLDQIEFPVKLIIADGSMHWPFELANKRNIPVAAYWPMSASMFSVVHHVDLLESHHHLYVDVSERGKEIIDYIPGLSSLTVADIPNIFHGGIGEKFKDIVPKVFGIKANYVLISTMYELESEAIDALRATLKMPIYTSGPNIPYSEIKPNPSSDQPIYIKWLDSKPPRTVLYVSLGSFLSVSSAEMAEIASGLTQSGVNFLWVARGETSHLKEICGENGMVVEWCDQLKVLLHSSIGGFWTHCGWNSVKECLFSGVPMLTCPILLDQPLSSKMIVKDWKTGWNMRDKVGVFKRDEIAKIVGDFMDLKSVVRIEMMERAKAFSRTCQESVGECGSVNGDLDAFLRDIVMN